MSDDLEDPSEGQMNTVSRVMEPERLLGPSNLDPGDQVLDFKILEKLGEGGFAIVYLAEQIQPVRRRVALKILKRGMDSKEIIARFEAERQALALLDHAHVAKVLDAGTTEGGRPYFAMEYVAGVPITEYCDRNKFSIEERLKLFSTVCAAIWDAHRNALIHRDIKPSNVLVADQSGEPIAKIIDFGVAKSTSRSLTDKTIHTASRQLIGTPSYMSPEQAEMSNEKVDTRTDVYALGMLLYELLTGVLPFDPAQLETSSVFELQSFIRSFEVPKPSDRLRRLRDGAKAIAEKRRSDPQALVRELRGDLDWIILRALEKERVRRYDTPKALAEDLQRHARNEPVEASPPSWTYKGLKFVRRNTMGVVAVSIGVIALLVISVTKTIDARRLAEERDAAQTARDDLERVVDFQAGQLRQLDMEQMGGRFREHLLAEHRAAMKRSGLDADEMEERSEALHELIAGTSFTDVALETLDEGILAGVESAIDEQFGEESLIRARLLQTLSTTMSELGLYDGAERPQLEALDIRRHVLGDHHPDTIASVAGLGLLRHRQGRLEDAEGHLRAALAWRRRQLGDEHVDTLDSLNELCINLYRQGRFEEAELYCREALQTSRETLGREHPLTHSAINNFATWLADQGRREEAESYYREAFEISQRMLGPDHFRTLTSLADLGLILKQLGRRKEAEPLYKKALEGMRRTRGHEHQATLTLASNMGLLLLSQGKLEEAELYISETLATHRRVLGERNDKTLNSLNNMGALRQAQARFAESEQLHRKAWQGFQRLLGNDHWRTRVAVNGLAVALVEQSKFEEAEQLLRESIPLNLEVLGEGDWRTAELESLLGEALTGQQRYEEAERHLLEGLAGLEAELPEAKRASRLPPAVQRLAELYEAWGKDEAAARWRAKLSSSGSKP